MINSISGVESKKSPFDIVSQRKTSDYWMVNNDDALRINLPMVTDITFLSPDEARKTHNMKTIGLSIAMATIFTAGGIFFVFRGGPKAIAKNFRHFRNLIERKLQKSKLDMDSNPLATKVLAYSLNKSEAVLSKVEAVNNLTTIKDLLFKKLLHVSKFGSRIHNKITKIFSKIARTAVKNTYKETYSSFRNTMGLSRIMESKIYGKNLKEVVEINGKKQTIEKWLTTLAAMNSDFLISYEKFFGNNAQLSRLRNFTLGLKNLQNNFKEKGALWFLSKDTLNRFVADGTIASDKAVFQKMVKQSRNLLSRTSKNLASDAEEKVIELTKLLNYKDFENISSLKQILKGIQNATKNKTIDQNIISDITKQLENLKSEISSSKNVKVDSLNKLIAGIKELQEMLISFKQGKLEDILDIYKSLLSKLDYQKLENAYRININSLDKSIKLESEDYLNKLRDLTLGSAPTDILSVVTAFGTLGYYLCKSENNRERTSISLTYGIPALVGIGTMLYGNAKLFAGSKSLLFGFVSMWLTNRVGDFANRLLDKHWDKMEDSKQASAA